MDSNRRNEFDMGDVQRRWYAVATKPRQEDLVCKVYGMSDIECFFPRIPVPQGSLAPKDTVVKPMFPGYLFARACPSGSEWTKVMYSPGVKGVVSFGGIPAEVPETVVSELRARTTRCGTLEVLRPFDEGDIVVIEKGPLRGLTAVFKGYVSDNGRVKLLMELLRRCIEVEASVDQIKRIG